MIRALRGCTIPARSLFLPKAVPRRVVIARHLVSASPHDTNAHEKEKTEKLDPNNPDSWKLMYEGPFTPILKRLRRVSIASAIGSAIGLPLAYVFGIPSATISIAGQVGIVGTVLISSLSSTFFLQLVTSPYVTQMRELEGGLGGVRFFRADRLNYFGNAIQVTFALSQVNKVTSSRHPYASCVANEETYMYFHGKDSLDDQLKQKLTNGP
jgi:hypothetical protein